ncbi:hypothetical protein [Parabacteroides merdae]|uniref:hypothetical protein n=1 Tax=Parabacteroides merdae TaxID=46503 RepID=UPI0018AAB261|nr:hypothetical protein [Parabacteroides merdae]MDB9084354.1 hypothetical protein [Parabacteroides merdae]
MIENSILLSLYNDAFASIHCQIYKGKLNIAKPLVIMAMLELIEQGDAVMNKFNIADIKESYERLQKNYSATTPYQYPIYFLENESFYHLKWKNSKVKTHTPSAKLIRENVEYAYFDNALWDLVQDQEMRNHFRTIIENCYLN